MAFTLRSNHSAMSEINVTPLVDVMLVLVVVFLVTAPLLTQSLTVALPKTAATRTPAPTQTLALTVNRQGEVFLDQRPVALGDLEQSLRTTRESGAQTNVTIQADDAVPFGTVARVMALAQRAGIERMSVVTLVQ